MKIVRYALKAIIAAAVAFLGSLATALADQHGVSTYEWVTIFSATALALAGVFGIQNGPKPRAKPRRTKARRTRS